jgi:NitT/TauT family transport system substrate-binding protein
MLLSVALAAFAAAGCGPSDQGDKSARSGGPVTIRVAGGDGSAASTPFFAAQKQGFFRDAGLNVTFVTLSGGSTAMDAALSSGAIDVGIASATQLLGDYARGVAPGKIIGELADNNYVILGGDGITNVRQLKGKTFGVSNYNAGDHLYSKAVLAHFGVGPDDVNWLAVGTPGGRLAALEAGKVAGIEMPLTNLPDSAAKRIIVGADNSPFPFISNAIFAREAFLQSNKPALGKFLAAIGKGADWVRAHPADAVPACMESGTSADSCTSAIKTAIAAKNPYTWSPTSRVNTDAIKAMIPVVAEVVPEARRLTVADVVDTSIAEIGAAPQPSR